GGAGGGAARLPDVERLRAGDDREAARARVVAGDDPDRVGAAGRGRAPPPGAARRHPVPARAAANLPRRDAVRDDPHHDPAQRAARTLLGAGGRRAVAGRPRAARDAAGLRAQGPGPAGAPHQRPAPQQPPLRPPAARRRRRHRGRRVPAVAAALRAVGAGRLLRERRGGADPHRLRLGVRPAHRLRRLRHPRPLAERRAVTPLFDWRGSLPRPRIGGSMRPRLVRTFVVLLLLGGAARATLAPQPHFWKGGDARDFLDGDTEGLSIDSEGRVRLAPSSKLLHDPESPYVWSLVRDPKGRVFAGTGNEGKVFAVDGGKGTLLFDASALEVHALAVGPDGRLYVGTSPEGKVYAVDAAGKSTVFFGPSEKCVWALPFDKDGRLSVATGAEGKVYRVDREGKGVVVLTSGETHITALAAGGAPPYRGSAPGGILYRIDGQGHVFVLHDSPYREVKALQPGTDGSLYAAVVDGREKDEASRAAPTAVPAPVAAGGAEVTVTETFGPV